MNWSLEATSGHTSFISIELLQRSVNPLYLYFFCALCVHVCMYVYEGLFDVWPTRCARENCELIIIYWANNWWLQWLGARRDLLPHGQCWLSAVLVPPTWRSVVSAVTISSQVRAHHDPNTRKGASGNGWNTRSLVTTPALGVESRGPPPSPKAPRIQVFEIPWTQIIFPFRKSKFRLCIPYF